MDGGRTPTSSAGRYAIHDKIAAGGMGSVHLACMLGAAGFSRVVAIKQIHPSLAGERELVAMFLDEARLAGRLQHPNIVATLDVVETDDDDVLIVLEYVHGESLARLLRSSRERNQVVSPPIASAILSGVLYGLHAAHEATDEGGMPLRLVHRDVSPQNVLIGVDGIARVCDFGVAKAAGRAQATTADGHRKGKLGYMPPEQLRGESVERRADVYAAGVVLWETLTGESLFSDVNEGRTVAKILYEPVEPPSAVVQGLAPALDEIVMRAIARAPEDRFATAREMCAALIDACPPAAPHEVGEWVEACAHEGLALRAVRVKELERGATPARGATPVRAERDDQPSEVRIASRRESSESPTAGESTISMATPAGDNRRSPSRSRGLVVIAAACALVLAVLLVAGVVIGQRTPVAATPATPASASPPAETTGASPPGDGLAAAAAPSGAPATEGKTIAAPATASGALARPAARAVRGQPASGVDCSPPYVRMPDGNKKWKRECFASPR